MPEKMTLACFLDGPFEGRREMVSTYCRYMRVPWATLTPPVMLISQMQTRPARAPEPLLYAVVPELDGKGRSKEDRFFALDEASRIRWWAHKLTGSTH